jgi:hypothetical protein
MGASDDVYTYDRPIASGGPYVPSVTDLGGAEMEDDAENPPDQEADPTAGKFNETARNLAGVNRVISKCVLEIEWDGTTNADAYSVINCDAMGTDASVTSESFALTRQSTGAILVEWEAGALPPANRKPRVDLSDDFGSGWGTVDSSTSVSVRLRDGSNVAADAHFLLEIRSA